MKSDKEMEEKATGEKEANDKNRTRDSPPQAAQKLQGK